MKRTTRLQPEEVEKMFQEIRDQEGYTEAVEKKLIKKYVKEATQKLSNGKKAIVDVEPCLLHIPDWQRDLYVSTVMKIVSGYNPYKFDIPKVLYNNGKLYIINGEHRGTAALKLGLETVEVEIIVGKTEKEAIRLFLDQSDDMKDMNYSDRINAALAAEDSDFLQLKRICAKHNVAIKGDRKPCENPVGLLTSISDGLKTSPFLFDRILELLGKLQWNAGKTFKEGKAYGSKPIRVLKDLYAYYAEDSDKMEQILLKYCKGGTFFNENLSGKCKYAFFDFLAEIIESHMQVEDIASVRENKTKTA